jgi:hypothetical protein
MEPLVLVETLRLPVVSVTLLVLQAQCQSLVAVEVDQLLVVQLPSKVVPVVAQ